MTGFAIAARVAQLERSPSWRTPHSRTTPSGAASDNAKAVTTSRPMRSASRNPVSSKTPRPTASTRASRSQTTKPVEGAG